MNCDQYTVFRKGRCGGTRGGVMVVITSGWSTKSQVWPPDFQLACDYSPPTHRAVSYDLVSCSLELLGSHKASIENIFLTGVFNARIDWSDSTNPIATDCLILTTRHGGNTEPRAGLFNADTPQPFRQSFLPRPLFNLQPSLWCTVVCPRKP